MNIAEEVRIRVPLLAPASVRVLKGLWAARSGAGLGPVTIASLANSTGLSERSVFRAIAELEDGRIIRRTDASRPPGQRAFTWTMRPPEKWGLEGKRARGRPREGKDMSHWFRGRPLAVIDTETTGKEWDRDHIVELAVVLLDGGEVTGQHCWLINPGVPIPPGATAIHGITDGDVEGAPSFSDVADDILRLLAGRFPVAYSVPFDRSFLQGHVRSLSNQAPDPGPWAWHVSVPAIQYGAGWADVLVWAREVLGDLPDKKLATVATHLNVSADGAHRALADAIMTAKVLIQIADRIPADWDEMLAAQEAAAARHNAKFASRDW